MQDRNGRVMAQGVASAPALRQEFKAQGKNESGIATLMARSTLAPTIAGY